MSVQLCQKYFLNLLGSRDYSENQLTQKGLIRKYSQADIDAVLILLKEYKYVDDLRLAQNLVQSYTGQKGKIWIIQKLKQKGIETAIIESVIPTYRIKPSNQAKKAIEQKYSISNWSEFLSIDTKTKNKVIYYLSSRGFENPFEIIKNWQNSQE